jgi:serine/threonine-protein kinase RsbT
VATAEVLPVRGENDVVLVRHAVRTWSVQQGFSLVDQTKMVTAASEIARNTVLYGRGGTVRIETLADGIRKGLRLVFEDQGPGIPDIDLVMRDGYSTGTGLGMGLGGARRLVNEFRIESTPGQGTKVTLTRWK